jgi:hypothetical protein
VIKEISAAQSMAVSVSNMDGTEEAAVSGIDPLAIKRKI